jgi:hypothetical protein
MVEDFHGQPGTKLLRSALNCTPSTMWNEDFGVGGRLWLRCDTWHVPSCFAAATGSDQTGDPSRCSALPSVVDVDPSEAQEPPVP